MQPLAVNPSRIASAANMTVTRYLGFLYIASRYTFSPPDRGYVVPSSSQIMRPQNESKAPSAHRNSEAPTEPTDLRIDDGVEKMPVPMICPILIAMVRQETAL